MTNEYSVEIHKYLTARIKEAEKRIEENVVDKVIAQGQIKELLWIRDYLRDNIDLKDFIYY